MSMCPCLPTNVGSPSHLDSAHQLKACSQGQQLSKSVQDASLLHYLNVIYGGCKEEHPSKATRADGVLASLTHRPNQPPEGIQSCPKRVTVGKPCRPKCREPCHPPHKQTVCESHHRPASFYEKHQPAAIHHLVTQHAPTDLLAACPQPSADANLRVPPYLVPGGLETGTAILACTDRYLYDRRKLEPTRPLPLQPVRVDEPANYENDCGSVSAEPHHQPTKQERRPDADCVQSTEIHRMRNVNTCGLTGVAGTYRGNPNEHLAVVHPTFHQPHINIDLAKCLVPWTAIPPYIAHKSDVDGVPIRCATDCVRKLCGSKCPHPVRVDNMCPDVRSSLADIGFYNTTRDDLCIYPCCSTEEEKRCATKTYRWTSEAQRQMNEICYHPRTVIMSNTTYEPTSDRVRHRAQRYEPVTAVWQQVPTVWDKAQARPMIDHVSCDHEYTPKITVTPPTGKLMRHNKMVMKPCKVDPGRYCCLTRDLTVEVDCKLGKHGYEPDVDQRIITCPTCLEE